MGEREIAQFVSSLASELRVSASTQNQALNAILFVDRAVMRKEIGYVNGVIRAKRPYRLPVVLTRQEVKSILGILDRSDWLMVMLFYGADLRLMQCLQLRIKDIDFTSNQISVRAGKGDKDSTYNASHGGERTTRQAMSEQSRSNTGATSNEA